jgi:hypothetical protein
MISVIVSETEKRSDGCRDGGIRRFCRSCMVRIPCPFFKVNFEIKKEMCPKKEAGDEHKCAC